MRCLRLTCQVSISITKVLLQHTDMVGELVVTPGGPNRSTCIIFCKRTSLSVILPLNFTNVLVLVNLTAKPSIKLEEAKAEC